MKSDRGKTKRIRLPSFLKDSSLIYLFASTYKLGQLSDVRPTFDFQQELLWNGEDLEVLEPLWLRREIAGKVKRMWNKYKEDK